MKPGKPLEEIASPNKCKLLTLIIVSVTLLTLGMVPVFIDPVIASTRYMFRIAKGTLVYDILNMDLPGALVEAYIFNITNADRFLSGEDRKLKVEEVGPFTYQEHRKHEDFYLDEEEGTLHYTPRITPRFRPELSVADPKTLNVSVPNIPLLTMTSTLGEYHYWTQFAFNMLAGKLGAAPVLNLRAHDFLWGYNEPLIALGNQYIPGWINFQNLGLMDRLYDQTRKDRVVIGASDKEKFLIKTVNGAAGIDYRGYGDERKRTRCNTFANTYEGLAYPPGLTPETNLRIYRNVFCRILDLQYVGSTDTDFVPEAFVYRFSNTTFRKNSENQCLCDKVCVDGMTDLSKCFYGFGVSFSQAHFYDVAPYVYERIEGVHPDFEKHGSEFIIDPNYGSVLNTRLTLQLNLIVENADFNTKTKPFSHMVVPVLYFKIVQPDLPEDAKATMRNLYFVFPYIVLAIQGVLFFTAIILLAYAIRFLHLSLLCKRALGFHANKNEKSPPVLAEEPLIEKNPNFIVELIPSNHRVDRVGGA